MKLFFIFFIVLSIFLIPIPIKINIYYSQINYYIKLYGFTIISRKKSETKKKLVHKAKSTIENQPNIFKIFYKNINFKSLEYKVLISKLYNSKFKPLLKIDLFFDYSLNDAAKTAIFYGILCQAPSLIYLLLNIPFNLHKFNMKINPIFEDKFLLKIETSSIFFLSFANAIYIIFFLFKLIKKQGR
ncbi:hypothetical protein CLPUN_33690 [Clostridium puniceum]|uniref:DUF2953 domain-containing protein n=1 Tax=Clostridium puniceum TaxID=29367 RepID=A0A1S8TCA1_9CLOT|nr:DUF2953 domain-containing protein [Clostridium puniceum]OOM75239.1 hypothetical protein CLPUN_33690 [Clostridium puniceum]